jgi:1,4-alpha-glucan branching enzyme
VARLDDGGREVALHAIHPDGVWEGEVRAPRCRCATSTRSGYASGSFTLRDPYAFPPTLGDIDVYLAGEGRHHELYERLGAHVRELDEVRGTSFAVWAPSARSVSVIGEFNSWDGRLHPMRSLGSSGIWEVFVPGVDSGAAYKFEIRAQDGALLQKADPFAFAAEVRRRRTP